MENAMLTAEEVEKCRCIFVWVATSYEDGDLIHLPKATVIAWIENGIIITRWEILNTNDIYIGE